MASGRAAVNDNLVWEAPDARPSRSNAGHAAATNRLSAASAPGATSVATTSRPLARKSADQLAPMTPVPIIAIRRMGLFFDMSLLLRDFGVGDAGEVATCAEEISFTGSVEPCGVDRSPQVSHEHAIA